MPRKSRQQVIGFCGAVVQDVVNQRLAGVVRYVEEHSDELALRDFRFTKQLGVIEENPPPPWAGLADGVIICFGVAGSATAMGDWLLRGGAPVVSLVREWSHPQIPIVDTDGGAAMKMAADYFVHRGFRNFAFVGDGFSLKDTPTRREQFAARLAEYGFQSLACDFTFRPDGSFGDVDQVVHEKGLIQFLKRAPKPLALFALNDDYARAISVLCTRMKIEVPAEIAILGSGNFTASRCNSPTLSTVQTPNDRIGYESAKLLHRMMRGEPPPTRAKLFRPLRILERQSTTTVTPHKDQIRAAVDYIREYACSGIHVDDVVRMLDVSRRSFENHFTERIGKTPKQLIQEIRLERANQLLAQTQLSITQVAMMTGFSDVAAFTNFVRKQTGSTPSEIREQVVDRG